MSLLLSRTLCWILDEAYEDYETIWELASVFQQRQPELSVSEMHEQLRQGLTTLQELGYVAFWQGVHFRGDEQPITPELTAGFIAPQTEAWQEQDVTVPEIKCYITESETAFYKAHCFDPAMWDGSK